MDNIILIGMPGAGKSTVGVVLAKKLGYAFLDSDLLMQEREKKLLHEIIEEKGLDVFKKLENEVNTSILTEHTIIATGGSVIYGIEAMMHLKSLGSVIYLKLDYEELQNRLGNLTERGVAIHSEQTLKDLYEERTPLYEKYADITIDCSQKTIRKIVLELTDLLYYK